MRNNVFTFGRGLLPVLAFALSACIPEPEVPDQPACAPASECCVDDKCQIGKSCTLADGANGQCGVSSVTVGCTCGPSSDGINVPGTTEPSSPLRSGKPVQVTLEVDRGFVMPVPMERRACAKNGWVVLPVSGTVGVTLTPDAAGDTVQISLGSAALKSPGTEIPCVGQSGPLRIAVDDLSGRGSLAKGVEFEMRGRVAREEGDESMRFVVKMRGELNDQGQIGQLRYGTLSVGRFPDAAR